MVKERLVMHDDVFSVEVDTFDYIQIITLRVPHFSRSEKVQQPGSLGVSL